MDANTMIPSDRQIVRRWIWLQVKRGVVAALLLGIGMILGAGLQTNVDRGQIPAANQQTRACSGQLLCFTS